MRSGAGSTFNAGRCCMFLLRIWTLAVPLILGMPFLEDTETLSKYRDRFVEQTVPFGLALQVNLTGSPARSLLCALGGEWATANTDSGSDADFLSAKYAQSREFQVEPNQETIMFADGSTDVTDGFVRLPLAIEYMEAITLEFHVFGSLTHDQLEADSSYGETLGVVEIAAGKMVWSIQGYKPTRKPVIIFFIPNIFQAFESIPIIIRFGSSDKHTPIITNNRDV
ncbi:uncharacterized protein PG986_014131 [Apiospora aurea]|uniref:Uncharacterized protein n=1 Tax=Apiospora aurea TaxID=335848 RepID=A0ABR1PS56_9PEZI